MPPDDRVIAGRHYNNNTFDNIMKVYIERNNIQVELIRLRKKYRLYWRLRSEEFNATDVFTLGKSLQHIKACS